MQRIAVDGGELEYETAGEGEPLVLVHGAIVGDAFKPLLSEPALTDHYRVINYHRRGFLGSTKHTGAPFSIAQQVEDALAVIQQVAGGRAHVAGHSYGGSVVTQLAYDAPEAVHSLLLLEGGPGEAEGEAEFFASIPAIAARYEAGEREAALDELLELILLPGYREPSDRHLPAGWFEASAEDLWMCFAVELPALAEWKFTKEQAKRITQPILCVLGSDSGPLLESAHEAILEFFPQAETYLLPDATHGLQYMNPRGAAEGMAAFLAKHPMLTPAPA